MASRSAYLRQHQSGSERSIGKVGIVGRTALATFLASASDTGGDGGAICCVGVRELLSVVAGGGEEGMLRL